MYDTYMCVCIYLCCILKLYQMVGSAQATATTLIAEDGWATSFCWFCCALKITFGANISELKHYTFFFVGAVSNLIHYIIYYNIIPLLLDISSIIINIHNNGMIMLYEWDDHGIIPSISHDFTMILPFTKHAWRVRPPGLRSDSLLTCALTLSPLSSDGKRSFGASDWCQSQRLGKGA